MNQQIGAEPVIEFAGNTVVSDDSSDLSGEEIVAVSHVERVSDSPIWEQMPEPEDNPQLDAPMVAQTPMVAADMLPSGDESDERAILEQELARLDVEWSRRSGEGTSEPVDVEAPVGSGALAELEADLSDLEL
jgi:hypothetical protein